MTRKARDAQSAVNPSGVCRFFGTPLNIFFEVDKTGSTCSHIIAQIGHHVSDVAWSSEKILNPRPGSLLLNRTFLIFVLDFHDQSGRSSSIRSGIIAWTNSNFISTKLRIRVEVN